MKRNNKKKQQEKPLTWHEQVLKNLAEAEEINKRTMERLKQLSELENNTKLNACYGCKHRIEKKCPVAVHISGFCPKKKKNVSNVKSIFILDFLYSNQHNDSFFIVPQN